MAQQNQISNLKAISKISYFSVLTIFTFLLSAPASAQKTELLNTKLSALQQLDNDYGITTAREIKSLYSDIQPMLCVSQGKWSRYGETSPELVDFDISSVPLLYNDNELYANVRMVRIHITQPADFQQQIDLSRMVGFGALKYVCFLISFDSCQTGADSKTCVPEKVNKMIVNAAGKSWMYLAAVEIPE